MPQKLLLWCVCVHMDTYARSLTSDYRRKHSNHVERQNSIDLRETLRTHRRYDRGGRQSLSSASKMDYVSNSPTSSGSQASGVIDDGVDVPQLLRRQHRLQRHGVLSLGRPASPRGPTSTLPAAGNIVECGPKSRGFPYASRSPVATLSVQSPEHTTITPDGPDCREKNI